MPKTVELVTNGVSAMYVKTMEVFGSEAPGARGKASKGGLYDLGVSWCIPVSPKRVDSEDS